jgi:hypothetical protein
MNQDYAQRRRVAVAIAITVVLVPAAVLLSRGNADVSSSPPVTLIGTVPGGGTVPGSGPTDGDDAPAATDAMGTASVGFLDGTAPARENDPATIAIPRLTRAIEGTASFRRDIVDTTVCQAPGVPFNTRITVTNRNNSRSVQCIASVGGPTPDDDVVLHTDAFLQIADITDAPVPVTITW